MKQAQLGCCYYPEHWSDEWCQSDFKRMRELGLEIVRMGEFAWSKLEPQPDQLVWDWLDVAMDRAADAGMQVVLGTPTATPPRWMLDKHPTMLAFDVDGKPRKFGSRRHYCFSYEPYWKESARIAGLMAKRYADHPALIAWQTDNEYGCHDTTRSYSPHAAQAFQNFLAEKYESVDALNEAWGNVFWSMEYLSFDEIGLPNLTVTEANPTHWLDFYRFSSDQVVRYNRIQVDAIKEFSDKPLIHNYMGRITDFDHFKLGDDLDISSWDTYPLGFLVDRSDTDEEWQRRFERQGDPDLQAMHHDLYRAVGRGRWWIMEQQPGPVNWAPNNPAPLPGMVAFWTWEAVAHEAEAVCYFRWRQAPFAQEQMHAGILRPDNEPAVAYHEVAEAHAQISELGPMSFSRADIAILFDYESCWAWEAQPQGENFDEFGLVLDFYRALRRLGQNIDLVPPEADLSGYKIVFAPGLFTLNSQILDELERANITMVLGPRTGSKTPSFQIPATLPPAISALDLKVTQVESFTAGNERTLQGIGSVKNWLEHCEFGDSVEVTESLSDGQAVFFKAGNIHYLAAWPDSNAALGFCSQLLSEHGLRVFDLPEGVRMRTSDTHQFIFNYNNFDCEFDGHNLRAGTVKIAALDA